MLAAVWRRFRRGGAFLYAVGIWTSLGYIAYYYRNVLDEKGQEGAGSPAETGSPRSEDRVRKIMIYKKPGGSSVITETVYKPNFVPYSTRLNNYLQSFFDGSGSKGK